MKAFRMCASYNLLGKLLSPYHLHVYNLCMYLFYTVHNTPPLPAYELRHPVIVP
jgi:hypothetical protein